MGPGGLDEAIANLDVLRDPNLLVGFETADDAAVYALDARRAVVATADFITPILDDPFAFGQVAAANSLSDVYAMGGRPVLALNLLGFPQNTLPPEAVAGILDGAAAVCREAGVVIGGGHTIRDQEVKFGLSVVGLVDPDRLLRNCTARPGDRLVLTKPLGSGALAGAVRAGMLEPDHPDYRALVDTMRALNRCGTELAAAGATSCTDVTGFGLTGHALEMAEGAGVTFTIDTDRLPLLPRAVELCGTGFTCGGTKANLGFTESHIAYADRLGEDWIGLLNDPQTSGGLLFSVPPDRCAEACAAALAHGAVCAVEIGEVQERAASGPHLRFV